MKIEFYLGRAPGALVIVDDSSPPRQGEFISIRKKTYLVDLVTWAVDHANEDPKLRANVILSEVT